MTIDHDNGKIRHVPLAGFRTLNILGMTVVLRMEYLTDENPQSIQLSLDIDQCREIAKQLWVQAALLELERPSPPQ